MLWPVSIAVELATARTIAFLLGTFGWCGRLAMRIFVVNDATLDYTGIVATTLDGDGVCRPQREGFRGAG